MSSGNFAVRLFAPYNYDVDAVSLAAGLDTGIDPETGEEVPSMTQQSFKEECDINEIMRRFGVTGELPENVRVPVSGDFTGVTDFQSAMEAVVNAQEAFMSLSADVREKFDNDPQKLMWFMEDEKNLDEARKLGLVNRPPERTRDAVQAIDELAEVLKPKA